MKNICSEDKCYYCGACESTCKAGAISCVENKKGFKYPIIDESICVDCAACQRVCPVNKEILHEETFNQQYYAAKHLDEQVRIESSSGGVFSALAEIILETGGHVYAATMDDDYIVRHICINTAADIGLVRKSKYIQSDIVGIIKDIEADLNNNICVLFSGTPCQVSGMRRYFNGKQCTEKLLLVDFICHGVASPKIFNEYISYIEYSRGLKVTDYIFRNKDNGWRNWNPKIILSNGENVTREYINKESYMRIYSTCMINRDSCYSCEFTSYNRNADITLGDFWNIGGIDNKLDDDKGVSEILVNTRKGKELFEKCKGRLYTIECTKVDVWQPHLEYPNEKPKGTKDFWLEYDSQGIGFIVGKYGKGSFVSECKRLLLPIARKLGLYRVAGKMYRLLFGN